MHLFQVSLVFAVVVRLELRGGICFQVPGIQQIDSFQPPPPLDPSVKAVAASSFSGDPSRNHNVSWCRHFMKSA